MMARIRSGFALIETVIAVALLAAATAGVAQLARIHSQIRLAADVRLAAELLAANQVESLHRASLESMDEMIDQLQSLSTPLPIAIAQSKVASESVQGTHVVVNVYAPQPTKRRQPLATAHYWLLEPVKPAAEDAP